MFAFVAYGVLKQVARDRAMRLFARRNNFAYLGGTVIQGLALGRASFGAAEYSIHRSMLGSLRGIEVAIFDLSQRKGKSNVFQTVVGFRRVGELGGSNASSSQVMDYEFEIAGDWIIAYIPRRVVNTDELEEWCQDLYELACNFLPGRSNGSGPIDISLSRLYQEV
jgi:hypothetical protein